MSISARRLQRTQKNSTGPVGVCTTPVVTLTVPDDGYSDGAYYVHNNMWNAGGYSVSQTMKVCAYNSWTITATADNNSGDGAVKTYPNTHKDYHDWGTGVEPTISSFTQMTSSFAFISPHVGIYDVAYDIWLNGVASGGSTEVMIWTENYHQVPGGSIVASASFGGKTFNVWRSGSYIAFVPTVTMLSGTLDLLAIFNWVISQGWIPANSTVGQVCFGVEIVSTGGVPADFYLTDFSITDS